MKLQSLRDLLPLALEGGKTPRAVIAGPLDEPIRQALMLAERGELCLPVYAQGEGQEAGKLAAALIREDKADFIIKGHIQLRDLLAAVTDKENGLPAFAEEKQYGVISTVTLAEVPDKNRLILLTNGGVNPTLRQKAAILRNAVAVARTLGAERPKAAVLCAVEYLNPKVPETEDARALQVMSGRGDIRNCDIIGPVTCDIALSAETAQKKGFSCPYCGRFDILFATDAEVGGILGAALEKAKTVSLLIGAGVPVVLPASRALPEEIVYSIAFASIISRM